jgi:hypothetical protein
MVNALHLGQNVLFSFNRLRPFGRSMTASRTLCRVLGYQNFAAIVPGQPWLRDEGKRSPKPKPTRGKSALAIRWRYQGRPGMTDPAAASLRRQAAVALGSAGSTIHVSLVVGVPVSIDHAINRSQVKHLAADIPPILQNDPSM